jgi:Tol biopolymer transport system component
VHKQVLRPFMLLAVATLFACSHDVPPGPSTGTLEIQIQTDGQDISTHGYTLALAPSQEIGLPVEGTITVPFLLPGVLTPEITRIAFNCDGVTPIPPQTIRAGDTTRMVVKVHCREFLSDAIVYTSGSDLSVMRVDGSRRHTLVADDLMYQAPAISPDGRQIAVVAWGGNDWRGPEGLYVMNADGSGRTQLTHDMAIQPDPAWSPDGKTIAFSGANEGSSRIWLINKDGSGLRPLITDTLDARWDWRPDWSPDGSTVIYDGGGGAGYSVRVDGTGRTRLPGRSSCFSPKWSPDGTQIACIRTDPIDDRFQFALYVMNSDGSNDRRITSSPLDEGSPSWSPDGSQLVFHRWGDGLHSQIYRIGIDGTGETRLSDQPDRNDQYPNWSRIP